jgi:tetratricopeptide (TPR) repeat protein
MRMTTMAEAPSERLDADELLHLAMAASRQGKSEEAITLLKRAVIVAPRDGRLHYLLGAEHAQIGLYDRAVEELQKAVQLNPDLETAHFQLGLLHLTSGRVDPAAEAWKPLDKLDHSHFLYLFKTGLLHLAKDEFKQAEEHLRRGLAANKTNQALNNDMTGVLKDIEKQLASNPAVTPGEKSATSKTTSKHALLSAYKKNRGDDKEN